MIEQIELRGIARQLATPGKGILASDESPNTIGKRLEKHGIENTQENRRKYRSLFYSAKLGSSISGAILFPEALQMVTDEGIGFVDALNDQGVLVGVKVDQGLTPLEDSHEDAHLGETCTKGLDTLATRCKEYKNQGAVFAKWRAAIRICTLPDGGYDVSPCSVEVNATQLAEYAQICHQVGIVPIVEPEILIDGDHDIDTFERISARVLQACVGKLWEYNVDLGAVLLKPQMVVPGVDCTNPPPEPTEIATRTLRIMRQIVPPAVPGIMFLSGGMTETQSTSNLNMLNVVSKSSVDYRAPWSLSFSFGRGLQASVLKMWSTMGPGSEQECKTKAEEIARVNGKASIGAYLTGDNHPSICEAGGTLQEDFRGHY
ncbi:hypothetical protein M9435_001367 [Picochlorum sp. BPE23]|nr:hypothetical protein M9435_001367 [Picochlorum sp. BPE23]